MRAAGDQPRSTEPDPPPEGGLAAVLWPLATLLAHAAAFARVFEHLSAA